MMTLTLCHRFRDRLLKDGRQLLAQVVSLLQIWCIPLRLSEHLPLFEAQRTTAPDRAITHYFAAELWEDASQTIEQISDELVRQGRLRTLRGWIEALPGPVCEGYPRLLYLLGLAALQRGELGQAMAFLEQARRSFENGGDQAGQGEALLAMVDTASRQHDYARQAALSEQALALPLSVHDQVYLLMARVWQSLYQGELERAVGCRLGARHPLWGESGRQVSVGHAGRLLL